MYDNRIPAGIPLPSLDVLEAALPDLATAAQSVYDAWDQVDGFDEELGTGGICQDIASAMVETLSAHGVEHALSVHAAVGENHVFVVALLGDGVYEIDIPPHVYETGSGYTWAKKPGVAMTGKDVVFTRLSGPVDPDTFLRDYSDG